MGLYGTYLMSIHIFINTNTKCLWRTPLNTGFDKKFCLPQIFVADKRYWKLGLLINYVNSGVSHQKLRLAAYKQCICHNRHTRTLLTVYYTISKSVQSSNERLDSNFPSELLSSKYINVFSASFHCPALPSLIIIDCTVQRHIHNAQKLQQLNMCNTVQNIQEDH